MKNFIPEFVFLLISVFAFLFFAAANVYAHGEEGGMMGGSGMMPQMMQMMHSSLDANRDLDCKKKSGEEIMEIGEDMMEQMFGHEDHERIEEAMEKDMNDHDSMHTMMGMWATGCVGDEMINTLMEKHGVSQKIADLERGAGGAAGWSYLAAGVLLGLAAGIIGSMFLRRKPESQTPTR